MTDGLGWVNVSNGIDWVGFEYQSVGYVGLKKKCSLFELRKLLSCTKVDLSSRYLRTSAA